MTNPTLFAFTHNTHAKLAAMRRAFPNHDFSIQWREADPDPVGDGSFEAEPAGYWLRVENIDQPMEILTSYPTKVLYAAFLSQTREFSIVA